MQINPRSYKSIKEATNRCQTRGELMKTVIAAFRKKKTPAEEGIEAKKENKPSTPTRPSSEVSSKI